MGILIRAAREVADRAHTAAELAVNRCGPGDQEEAYAQGVEDVLRWLCGDAKPTEPLTLVLRAGRLPGDDVPEDDPALGFPKVNP